MGNSHGHHRKHRNSLPHNSLTPAPPPSSSLPSPHYKYGTHPQTQKQSSSNTNNNMLSLPYARVESTLRALAGQAEGFGRSAIGGLHGRLYHVTTLAGQLIPTLFPLHFMSFTHMHFNKKKLPCLILGRTNFDPKLILERYIINRCYSNDELHCCYWAPLVLRKDILESSLSGH